MKTFHSPDIKQVTFCDERFYSSDNETFYPSVTTILDVYPKGFGFDEWLKSVGNNAAQIVERAAEFGSRVHEATEKLNKGQEIFWEGYSKEEWLAIYKYFDFWQQVNPHLLANELSICVPELGYGGTIDRVVIIGGKTWLLDIKTSNYIHKTHELQLAAYAVMWNKLNPDHLIDHTGIVWLKAQTRTSKVDHDKNIFQGSGWQIKTFDRHYNEAFKIFLHVQSIWKEENPVVKPLNMIYPDRLRID